MAKIKKQRKAKNAKILFVMGVADVANDRRLITLITDSLDHLRANLKRFKDEDIYYLARRNTDKNAYEPEAFWKRIVRTFFQEKAVEWFGPDPAMGDRIAFSVTSKGLGERIRTKEQALSELLRAHTALSAQGK